MMQRHFNTRERFHKSYQNELNSKILQLQRSFLYFILLVYGSYNFFIFLLEWLADGTINSGIYAGAAEIAIALVLLAIVKLWLPKHEEHSAWFALASVTQFLVIAYLQYAYLAERGNFFFLIFAITASSVAIIRYNGLYAAVLCAIFAADMLDHVQMLSLGYDSSDVIQICIEDVFIVLCTLFINKSFTRMKRKEIIRESRLIEQRDRDGLTGLLNRAAAMHYIARNSTSEGLKALLLLDVDNFKEVNDTLGHGEGDAVLMGIADTMRDIFGADVCIARLGGDEFLIFVTNLTNQAALEVKAETMVRRLKKSIIINQRRVDVSCSVGIAFCPQGAEASFQQLYEQADEALYQSKGKGKSCYTVWCGADAARSGS